MLMDPANAIPSAHKYLLSWQHNNQLQYCFCVVVPLLVGGGIFASTIYGFNVFVLDVRSSFNPGEAWSMATGSSVYVGGLSFLSSSIMSSLVGGRMAGGPEDPSGISLRKGCLGGAILYSGGLALSGLAMSFKQLWLLYLGYGLLSGAGAGAVFYATMLSTLMNFRAAGRPGLGAGLSGLVFGMWPAILSLVKSELIALWNISGTFYCLAVGTFAVLLLVSFFLRLPPPSTSSSDCEAPV
jgi:OFA family oxalate/formate antiporter-like MFS transporter